MSNTENNSVFHYSLHQKLWNILAENPGMSKYEALDNFFTKEEKEAFDSNGCAACTYTKAISENDNCEECPLDTNNVQVDEFMEDAYNITEITCLKKLYTAWDITVDAINTKKDPDYIFTAHLCDSNGEELSEEKLEELCSKYAKMIANLPVKSGVIYD